MAEGRKSSLHSALGTTVGNDLRHNSFAARFLVCNAVAYDDTK